jgi:hypothetical protein
MQWPGAREGDHADELIVPGRSSQGGMNEGGRGSRGGMGEVGRGSPSSAKGKNGTPERLWKRQLLRSHLGPTRPAGFRCEPEGVTNPVADD